MGYNFNEPCNSTGCGYAEMSRVSKPRPPESFVQREYRAVSKETTLVSSLVRIKDTDLQIFSERDVTEDAKALALQYRLQIESYIQKHPGFERALLPLKAHELAPAIVKDMCAAGLKTGIGPMASVAGSIAEFVGVALLKSGCREVIVENGGDVYLHRDTDATVAIFAGDSPLSMCIGVKLKAERMPLGVCTSSGTVGHSLSFGVADSVTVISKSTSLADSAATRLGNEVGKNLSAEAAIQHTLELGRSIEGVDGIVVVLGDKVGAVGDVELIRLG